MSGRLVIVACGYAFNEFVGFDCYDVDNECFCVIWAKDISKHKIWGIDKGKIKELPTLSCEQDCYNQGFENSKLLRDYRNLPCIDVRTGTAYNINNCVVVSKYVSEGLTYYKCVCYNNKQVGIFEASKLREMILGNNIYFCNLKKCSDRISPLGKSFYSDKSILNKLLLLKSKLSPVKYPSELEKLQQHSNQEAKKDIERRTSVILKDVSRYDKEKGSLAELDKKNRAYFVGAISNASNVMLPELKSLGIDNIISNKKELCRVANYIDSSTFLDELDNFVQYPCTDESCKKLLTKLKEMRTSVGDDRVSLLKRYFNNNFKARFNGNCSHCHSMLSMYIQSLLWRTNASGVSSSSVGGEIFIDVSKSKIFSLRTFFTTIHEYIHYLARGKSGLSGFCIKGEYSTAYKVLNEGFTDLLASYFVDYILRSTNKSDLMLLLDDKQICLADYSIVINPFLKSLSELNSMNLDDIRLRVFKTIMGYKLNVSLVVYLLYFLPVKDVFSIYFQGNSYDFTSLCEERLGKEQWSSLLNILNGATSVSGSSQYSSQLSLLKYKECLKLLKDSGDIDVK